MAKAPRPGTRANAPAATDNDTVIILDGVRYPFSVREITARDASDLRKATGLSVRAILAAAQDDPDIDVVAALVWLSRRQNGEPKIKFELVAMNIAYEADVDVEREGADEIEGDEGDDPQH